MNTVKEIAMVALAKTCLARTCLAPAHRAWMCLVVMCLGVMCLAPSYLSAQTPPELPPVRELLESKLSGEIRVGGAVVDASTGRPLAGVRLSVTEGSFDPQRPELRVSTRHKEEVTGAFRYQCSPCTDVRVRLSKDGYRSETLNFAVATSESNRVDETRLRVTLRPLQNPVELQAVQGELVAGDASKAAVLALDPRNRKARVVGLRDLPAKVAGQDDPFVLRLTTTTAADGKAALVDVTENRAKNVPVAPVHRRPVGATLDFSSIGGVTRHFPAETGPRAALRSMLEAPADGYSQFLELGTTTEPVFFYFRVGDRYGKGYLEAPWVDHEGTVRAHARLWLNGGGGRSVEAAYE